MGGMVIKEGLAAEGGSDIRLTLWFQEKLQLLTFVMLTLTESHKSVLLTPLSLLSQSKVHCDSVCLYSPSVSVEYIFCLTYKMLCKSRRQALTPVNHQFRKIPGGM